MENGLDLLAGVTHLFGNRHRSGKPFWSRRVHWMAATPEMISAEVDVEFTGGAAGTAAQGGGLNPGFHHRRARKGETVDTAGHLNTAVPAGDANDQVSFRVDAADLPPGGIAGRYPIFGVLHGSDGKTVVEYVFTQATPQ